MTGLANQLAGPTPQGQQVVMPTIDEIMALLMQGIDPQALIQQGIPSEMVMEAVAMLEQQMAAQQQAPIDPNSAGLAQGLVG